ncbi:RHS repeat-associated core domain-containing protein [Xanthomonas sp. 1678]|uniref:RHS repeat-associated core domain-containing protein n=2 Tax=Xanthomonas TaxID=338 RepID=UPI0028660608|nr:RHS repeat-associated protein [Xanthomonas translucens]
MNKIKNAALTVISLMLLLVAQTGLAQESDQTFTLYDFNGQQVGIYKTQQEAEAAISTIPVPVSFYDGIFSYVKEIRGVEDVGQGLIKINYWIGIKQPNDKEWSYQMSNSWPTEQEALQEQLDITYSNEPTCPYPSIQLTSDWYMTDSDGTNGGQAQNKDYTLTRYSGEDCELWQDDMQLVRTRYYDCPPQQYFTNWKNAFGGCVNEWAVASIVTQKSECQADKGAPSAQVGDPCDIKTGEQVEQESDASLAWIDLTRSYHSGYSTQAGAYGPGWSDSHRLRLNVTTASAVLVNGAGYTTTFAPVDSTSYSATDGSGDVLVSSSTGWDLRRASGVYQFDQSRRLQSFVQENGQTLNYEYDQYSRLWKIHSGQGRYIEYKYSDDSSGALITSIESSGVVLATFVYADRILQSVSYPDGSSRVYHYEDSRFPGHLTGITDESGSRKSTFTYDAKGRAISSNLAGGVGATSITYTPSGAQVTNALGEVETYAITTVGGSRQITSIADSAGTRAYSYFGTNSPNAGRLSSSTSRSGIVTNYEYSSESVNGTSYRLQSRTEAAGTPSERVVVERIMDQSNRVASVQDGGGSTEFIRNGRLQLIAASQIGAGGVGERTTIYSYCEAADVAAAGNCPLLGLLKAIDGPRLDVNDVTQYLYYASDDPSCSTGGACSYRKGDLWKVVNALGQSTEMLSYDPMGRVTSAKDRNGVVTFTTYTPRGNISSVTVRAQGAASSYDRVTLYEYWPTGEVKKITSPDGTWRKFDYDAAWRLIKVTDNSGAQLAYTLDNDGNRIQETVTDSNNVVRRQNSTIYNSLGQAVTQADHDGNATELGYDAEGRLTSTTSALNIVDERHYDALGRLTQAVKDATGLNQKTDYHYDPLGNLDSVKDPNGLTTTYSFNTLGDSVGLESPDTGVTTHGVDAAGNRIETTDARGVVTTRTFDALNRLTSVKAGSDALIQYVYDEVQNSCAQAETFAVGRLSRMLDQSGETKYCYNSFGDLVRTSFTASDGTLLSFVDAYDATGRISSRTYPDGSIVNYAYGPQGRVSALSVDMLSFGVETLVEDVTYAPFGPATGWSYGNGRALSRTFDSSYRAKSIRDAGNGGIDVGLSYDASGRLVGLGYAAGTAQRATLDYDGVGRLAHFRDGATGVSIESYSYDAVGNRSGLLTAAGNQAYSYQANTNRLSSIAGQARSYDSSGNTTSIGGTSKEFIYNDAGRMSESKSGGAVRGSYVYNGHGQQVKRTTASGAVHRLYDPAGHWLGDFDGAGQAIQQAIWLDDQPVGLLQGSSASTNRLKYVEADHLGSPRVVIDPAQDKAVWKWDLMGESFGVSPPNEDPDMDGAGFSLDMRYPGQLYDSASGLNQNAFRDYDPVSGRYIQSDPIGLDGGISTFSYAGSQPFSAADPFGLEWEWAGDEVPGWWSKLMVGTAAHYLFSAKVTSMGYGANDTYLGTFGSGRPDAYDPFSKTVFELKPISNRDNAELYRRIAQPQIARYLESANRPITDEKSKMCTGWTAGQSTSGLFSEGEYLGTIQVGRGFLRQVYELNLYHDTHPGNTGLVFYRAKLVDYPLGQEIDRSLRDMNNVSPWYVLPTLGNRLYPEK